MLSDMGGNRVLVLEVLAHPRGERTGMGLTGRAEALIVPSICFETFGIILIEAFRQGTPVIARRLGPFPEIIESSGGGELFETPDDLVGAMDRMRSAPGHRDRCGSAAVRSFDQRWSESAVVPAYLDLVRRAAERGERHEIARAIAEAA